jgi:hypothetical protein
MDLVRNDGKLLAYRERKFPTWTLPVILQKICMVNENRAMIRELKERRERCNDRILPQDSVDSSGLDETALANLEYLLLRLLGRLVLEYMRCARYFASICIEIFKHAHHKSLKFSGAQWSSEYAGNKRPLSTTWPWNILPSLAVLWGVCWMYHPPPSSSPPPPSLYHTNYWQPPRNFSQGHGK